MKTREYARSICSTCRHLVLCCLSKDKTKVSSCSEYVHTLEKLPPVSTNEETTIFSIRERKNDNKELILN
ncbi:hypothetical protein [Croceitalea dokdonensis]|uniref:hypothetical protein n=1 Tax=Croceitalea dokdonensis TaxID=346188 RepID=UPI0012F88700|nr:hypothetical protein [Croceitalea dokdonensis]